MIKIKRIYEGARRGDGDRILVDRLWPRALSKRAAAVDEWTRQLGPSHELRKWFAHDPTRWRQFQRRYRVELRSQRETLGAMARRAKGRTVTLLFAARDPAHNNAVVLKGVIERLAKRARRARQRTA